jgi:hypothetical protein
MKKLFVCVLLLASASAMAAINAFIWGHTGLAPQAAQLSGSMASMDGLLTANPLGEADAPGLSAVLLTRAAEVRANLQALAAGIDSVMDGLTQEQRQLVLNDYCAFMVEVRDLRTKAEGRFLDDVALNLGETYQVYGLNTFIWGNRYGLVTPPLRDINP